MPTTSNSDPDSRSVKPEEVTLWKGHTSQWVHFWFYLFCVALAVASVVAMPFTLGFSAIGVAVALVFCIGRWWVTRSTAYELTSQRFRITSGILNRRLDEIELYRVKDYVMEQPIVLRMLGLGNLTLITSDATSPTVAMHAVAGVERVRELLRTAVQSERDRKRVREVDLGESSEL